MSPEPSEGGSWPFYGASGGLESLGASDVKNGGIGAAGRSERPGSDDGRDGPPLHLTDPYRDNWDILELVFKAEKCLPADMGKLLISCSDSRVSIHGARICGCACSAAVFVRSFLPLENEPEKRPFIALPMMCESRWCPYCSRVLSADLADRVHGVLRGFTRADRLKHLVLTVAKCSLEDLPVHVRKLAEASRRFLEALRRSQGLRGYIMRIEVTVSDSRCDGKPFHVHTHIYADMDYRPQFELLKSWKRVAGHQGLEAKVLHVSALKDPAIAAYEISKYISKPIPKRVATKEIMQGLVKSFFGRRLFQSWGTLNVPDTEKSAEKWLYLGVVHRLNEAFERGDYDNCVLPESSIEALRQLSKHPQAAVLFKTEHMRNMCQRLGVYFRIES